MTTLSNFQFLVGKEKYQYKFSLEDTHESCYKDISMYLHSKFGWERVSNRKKCKTGQNLPNRRIENTLFNWVLNEKDLEFSVTPCTQVVNHFSGVRNTLTTKLGYCDLLKEMVWINENSLNISPRYFFKKCT